MPSVKGSKQEKMVVVPYRPWRAIGFRLGLLVCLAAAGFGGWALGFSRGVAESGDARAERDQLTVELQHHREQVETLRHQLVNAEQAGRVDRRTLEDVQSTLLGQREKIRQLEEDVLFYKRIMSPENDESGLMIGQLDLFPGSGERRFRYRLELKQMGTNEDFINGYANVNVLGAEGGEERSIPLRTLSEEENELDITLRFRYFQNIEGELELPPGFEPSKVQILAVSEGGAGKTVQKSFGWLVQDPINR